MADGFDAAWTASRKTKAALRPHADNVVVRPRRSIAATAEAGAKAQRPSKIRRRLALVAV